MILTRAKYTSNPKYKLLFGQMAKAVEKDHFLICERLGTARNRNNFPKLPELKQEAGYEKKVRIKKLNMVYFCQGAYFHFCIDIFRLKAVNFSSRFS